MQIGSFYPVLRRREEKKVSSARRLLRIHTHCIRDRTDQSHSNLALANDNLGALFALDGQFTSSVGRRQFSLEIKEGRLEPVAGSLRKYRLKCPLVTASTSFRNVVVATF